MRKGLSLILFGLLAGATAFLANLLKQKNEALDIAQTRIAHIERRMSQMMSSALTADEETQLRAQVAQQSAEIERLRALLADQEAQSRRGANIDWQARTPALAALEESLAGLSSAKLAFANRSLQARILPTIVDQPQDLSAVEGIGAVFEQRLYNAGIGAYWELAALDDETLRRVLKIGKAQAATVNLDAMRASARQLAETSDTAGYVWCGEPVDDFEPIPGIGKTYEQRLYDAGIRTYAALAQATPETLTQAIASRSPIPPDYAGWIEAAKKLANG